VSGAASPSACAEAARALFTGVPRDVDAFADAVRLKRALVRHGFRDDPQAFALPDVLSRRGGNCLGITLVLGAALVERGWGPRFAARINPFDDVHDAGNEHLATLLDPATGVHQDSRLPDAHDRSSRFRFAPVEHASLEVPDGDGRVRPFETTSLSPDVDPDWAPAAESIRYAGFDAICGVVWSERAKVLLHEAATLGESDAAARAALLRRSVRFALHAARAWPENREAWADVWRAARLLAGAARFAAVAERAKDRYARAAGADSLFAFTRYRMTGERAHLEAALARFPAYAEAYFEAHVATPLVRAPRPPELDAIRRHVAVAAWMVAESGVLDLERFYRERRAAVSAAFSAREVDEALASFA